MPLKTCDPEDFIAAYQNFSIVGVADIVANGDISGPGVRAGFFGTGWLVTILAIGYYLVGSEVGTFKRSHDATVPVVNLDLGMPAGSRSSATILPNPFDEVILCLFRRLARPVWGYLQRFLHFGPGPFSKNTSKALEKCILTLCDVQIVTGLGIMTAGYISAATSDLSVYHWHLIVYLAWFSNITHQAALILLQDYLRLHPRERMWRFCLMTVLVIMLLIALAPMAFHSDRGCGINFTILPVRCLHPPGRALELFHTIRHSSSQFLTGQCEFSSSEGLLSVITSAIVLVFSYTRRSIRLFPFSSLLVHGTLRGFLSQTYRKLAVKILRWQLPCRLLGAQLWPFLVLRPVLAFYLLGRFVADLISSQFFDIFWLVASATVGTFRLFTSIGKDGEGERTWAFGQILAIFLLIGPLLMLVQSLFGGPSPGSPPPATMRCQHCSLLHLGSSPDEQENGQLEIQTSEMLEPTNDQQNDNTTASVGLEKEVQRLLQRDVCLQATWNKFTMWVMVIMANLYLVLLLVFVGSQYTLVYAALGFAAPLITFPVICYSMIIYGLSVEGWRHERKVSFFVLVVVGISMILSFFAGVFFAPFGYPVLIAATPTTYLPLVAYFTIIPLVLCVKGRMTKGSQSAPPSRQHGAMPTGDGVVESQDTGHRYLTSPSLETGGSNQPGRDGMSFELQHPLLQAPPNAASQTSGR